MRVGRIAHPLNMPEGARTLARLAPCKLRVACGTDQQGLEPHPTPQAMSGEDIRLTIDEPLRP